MAVIEGQIEPLKKLRGILHRNGITRFSSIGEINDFRRNYEREKSEISNKIEFEYNNEVSQLKNALLENKKIYEDLLSDITNQITLKTQDLENNLQIAKDNADKSFLRKILCFFKIRNIRSKLLRLQKYSASTIREKTFYEEKQVLDLEARLNDYIQNKNHLISERCLQSLQEIEYTKEIIDDPYSLIAGAIGENAVIKEIEKLPDNFHLFNDFSVEFYPPIYNKKQDDTILSIQIDHLLICAAGIFILETKNWSKKSLDNLDLRSPIEQIRRSNYALFTMLNSRSKHNNIGLEDHHWGKKQIPVRNVIVMTHNKPKEEFQHVKILLTNELNGYITYFDPIFSSEEVTSICNYLRGRMISI